MKPKVLLFLITIVCVFLITSTAADQGLPQHSSGRNMVSGVNVGDPQQNGVVVVVIRIEVPDPDNPGKTKTKDKSKTIEVTGATTAQQKAEEIQKKAQEILNELGLKKNSHTKRKQNGKQVTFKIPKVLKPKVFVTSTATGEEDSAMKEKELKDFYKQEAADTSENDGGEQNGGDNERISFVTDIDVDDTIANSCQHSIILKGTPAGMWLGSPGGNLYVTVGVYSLSLSTQGVTLEQLANSILQHYTDLGYEVTLTGDPTGGFFINTGYFCPTVQAQDDTLEIGLGFEL
jgi:hypothetical protein